MQAFTIGRDPNNQIVLNDKLVSRQHAQLTFLDSGQVMIKDLGSSNGTFVNGNRISEMYLNPGDIVKCGAIFLNWSQYGPHNPNSGNVDFSAAASKAQEWNNTFVSFLNPFLGAIDNGSFFRRVFGWVYLIIAGLNILLPFYVLFKAIENDVFKSEGRLVLAFLVLWLALAILCWFGFQLWWNRRAKVNESSYSGAEFVATPVLAHFIQTIGEWYGVIVGVMGFLIGLLALFFGGANSSYYEGGIDDSYLFIPFLPDAGWQLIFLGPIGGFLIVFLFRFFSEAIKALTVIANNTKIVNR